MVLNMRSLIPSLKKPGPKVGKVTKQATSGLGVVLQLNTKADLKREFKLVDSELTKELNKPDEKRNPCVIAALADKHTELQNRLTCM